MTLPNIHTPDSQHWKAMRDQAQTEEAKAIIGALMLLAVRLDEIYDAVATKDEPNAEK